MKRAILSDIHGNLEALQAVLRDIERRGITEIYCLGDIVGYGPNPRECVDICRNFTVSLLGNHDQGALFDPEGFSANAEKAIFWTRNQLETAEDAGNAERILFLATLPRVVRENNFLFVHGSARAPLTEYVFPDDVYNDRKLQKIFTFIDKYCFQGHTHVPGIFTASGKFFHPSELRGPYELGHEKLMINVGSVGQPRDHDPRSCYVILEDNHLEYVRLSYPLQETQKKIFAIPELDRFLGERLAEGK